MDDHGMVCRRSLLSSTNLAIADSNQLTMKGIFKGWEEVIGFRPINDRIFT